MKKIIFGLLILVLSFFVGLYFYQSSEFKKVINSFSEKITSSNNHYELITDYSYSFPNKTKTDLKMGFKNTEQSIPIPIEIVYINNIFKSTILLKTNFNTKQCNCENLEIPIEISYFNKNPMDLSNIKLSTKKDSINKRLQYGSFLLKDLLIDVTLENYKSEENTIALNTKIKEMNANSNIQNIFFNIDNYQNTMTIENKNIDNEVYTYLKNEKTNIENLGGGNLSIGFSLDNLSSIYNGDIYKDRQSYQYDLNVKKISLPVSKHYKSLYSFDNFNIEASSDINRSSHKQFLNFLSVKSDMLIDSPFFATYIYLEKFLRFNENKKVKYNITLLSENDFQLEFKINSNNLKIKNNQVLIQDKDNFSFYFLIYKDFLSEINIKDSKQYYIINEILDSKIGFIDKFGNLLINVKTTQGKIETQIGQNEYITSNFDLEELKEKLFNANQKLLNNTN